MALATGQYTLLNLNDIGIDTIQPMFPEKNQLWLDISAEPNQLKRWNGAEWVVINDVKEEIIEYVNKQNTQLSQTIEGITQTVESTVSRVSDVENTYSTKTEVSTAIEGVTMKFSEVGGFNLLKNSKPKKEVKHWGVVCTNGTGEVELASGGNYAGETFTGGIWATGNTGNINSCWAIAQGGLEGYKFTLGKHYTFWAYVYNDTNTEITVDAQVSDFTLENLVGSSTGIILSPKAYTQIHFTFVPEQAGSNPAMLLLVHGDNLPIKLYIPYFVLVEGQAKLPWSPHYSETYEGVTSIDGDGITVEHSTVGTKTVMDSTGFKVYNGDTEIGSLAEKSGLSVLTSNEVHANNILTIQQTPVTLYVNGTIGDDNLGDGTSGCPYKSITRALQDINKVLLDRHTHTIYVYGNLVEDVEIYGYTGSGNWVTTNWGANYGLVINFDKTSTLTGTIRVAGCSTPIILIGNRSSYNTNDGCLLKTPDDTNHCILFLNSVGLIQGFRMCGRGKTTSNCGIYASSSNLIIRRCDLYNCSKGIYAGFNSRVFIDDVCGGTLSIGIQATLGSMVQIGVQGVGGQIPSADTTLKEAGGFIRQNGSLTTYNTYQVNSSTSTKVYTSSWSASSTKSWRSSYGWRSDNSYIYQGEFGGYGNHIGFIYFPASTIRGAISSAKIHSVQLHLQRRGSGGSSSAQKIYLYGHSHSTSGGGTALSKSYGIVGSYAWGESKTISIPAQVGVDLQSGVIQGLAIHSSSGSPYTIFEALASITIKYEK